MGWSLNMVATVTGDLVANKLIVVFLRESLSWSFSSGALSLLLDLWSFFFNWKTNDFLKFSSIFSSTSLFNSSLLVFCSFITKLAWEDFLISSQLASFLIISNKIYHQSFTWFMFLLLLTITNIWYQICIFLYLFMPCCLAWSHSFKMPLAQMHKHFSGKYSVAIKGGLQHLKMALKMVGHTTNWKVANPFRSRTVYSISGLIHQNTKPNISLQKWVVNSHCSVPMITQQSEPILNGWNNIGSMEYSCRDLVLILETLDQIFIDLRTMCLKMLWMQLNKQTDYGAWCMIYLGSL